MKTKKQQIEGALMLGATPREATQGIVKDVFTSAIMPTINSMVGMGIIFLPGMMTGQILAGLSPLVAIEYQIAIMLAILGSVSITLYSLTRFGYPTYFNQWDQLEEADPTV
jgi:putative ABC transport system permease protein